MTEPFTPSFYRQLQQLKIRTRRAFLGSRQGGHRSLRRGQGLEFADFRPYAPGDDFRHIDWGVLGRTDRVYVRQFREEQDLNVVVLLDTSASMDLPEGEGKFNFARNLALSIGYVALTDGDTVTFSLLGKQNTPRYIGGRAFPRARKELLAASPKGGFNLLTEVRAAIDRQRTPGKCFLISDFLIPLESQFETLQYLRSKNYEIVVLQVLAPSELKLPSLKDEIVIDSESGEELQLELDGSSLQEYALKLASHIEALESYCGKAGITHLLLSTKEDLASVLLYRFPLAGIVR